jgi:prepilin-type N-terminal cleavage/methylation domain-containing protein
MVPNLREKGITLIELSFVLSIIAILAGIAVLTYAGYRGMVFDAVTKQDLRKAYASALTYFLDFPEDKVTLSGLEKYGFKASPNVNIRIINGLSSNLLMVAFYDAPGTQAYMTYVRKATQPGASKYIWLAPIQGWRSDADQLAEQPTTQLKEFEPQENIQPVQPDILQVCNQAAMAELKEAYRAAQVFFQANPDGEVTKNILFAFGYTPDENVNLVISGGNSSDFSISSFFDIPGAAYYTTDSQGNMSAHFANR